MLVVAAAGLMVMALTIPASAGEADAIILLQRAIA